MTVGISAVVTGAAITAIMLLVSPRGPGATAARVTSESEAPTAVQEATRAAPPQAALSAPAKPTKIPPAHHPRPRVATNLDAKHVDAKHVAPAPKPTATNTHLRSGAPAATKQPSSVVTRGHTVASSTKAGAPAPKQPTQIATKTSTKAAAKGVTPATKQPVAPATARTSTPAGSKLAARTQPPAATAGKTATRTAQPAARGAAKPKTKSVASADPKPVATKKPPAR